MWTRILPFLVVAFALLAVGAGATVVEQDKPANDVDSRALQSASVTKLVVINTLNNTKLMDIFNSTIIDLAKIPMAEPSFNIRALVAGSNVRSVTFNLRGGIVQTYVETKSPYALCGNQGEVYKTCAVLGLSRHTVTVTVKSCVNNRCSNGPRVTVSFVIVDSRRTKVPAPIVIQAPANAPVTPCLTSSATNSTAAYINCITLSNQTLTMTGTSPEENALQWLVLTDAPPLTPDSEESRRRLRQRFAMLTVVFLPVKNRGGVISTMKDVHGLPIAQHECDWKQYFIKCNSASMVTVFALPGVYHTHAPLDQTTIPPDIGQLTSLTEINFSSNKLKGTLPKSLGLLTKMKYFTFFSNNLSSVIPTEIAGWSALEEAYFAGNDFSGTMPNIIGFCPRTNPSHGILAADCNEVTCPCCNECY